MTTTTAAPARIARQVSEATAAAHFRAGGAVCVSVNGEQAFPVTRDTTTHHRDRTSWQELTAVVQSYGDTRQRFYSVVSCSCAHHTDGSVTTMLCPMHADTDPCLTMARVTGRRRTGTIRRGVCTACGHGVA